MARFAGLFPGDEELGKRDDDHVPGTKSSVGLAWQHRRPHLRRSSLKRILLVLTALVALYYFFSYMPTDLRNPRPRPSYDRSRGRLATERPTNPGLEEAERGEDEAHYFDGPIKFYELAKSLKSAPKFKDGGSPYRNVVFAASSLTSASNLLNIACDMGIRRKSVVHFAIMGRDDIALRMLKKVNGITEECNIIFHDARPDYSIQSSDVRMEFSCSAGLGHIHSFLRPRALIIDGSGQEDIFFTKAIKARAESLSLTLIELPEDAQVNMMWISLLDSAALEAWGNVQIDILVHAPPASSGSLIRLLKSLEKADYFSSTPPRLTIELPNIIDEPTKVYLETFKWPPKQAQNTGSLLSLHHRISQLRLTPAENSIRFLETFWTSRPSASHVLVLSPQVELSPLFFHYLKYTVLEYKYSSTGSDESAELMGISLELPTRLLGESEEFAPHGHENRPFLWQAPNSNAALYFGEQWLELQSLVSHALSQPPSKIPKVVSKDYPSWLEYILKLSRARGYRLLYPNFSESIATVHTEIYNPPEEYSEPDQSEAKLDFTADRSERQSMQQELPLVSTSLLSTLGDLPRLKDLSLLAFNGEVSTFKEMGERAAAYRVALRDEMGCHAPIEEKPRAYADAADLFCDGDEVRLTGNDEQAKAGSGLAYSGSKVGG